MAGFTSTLRLPPVSRACRFLHYGSIIAHCNGKARTGAADFVCNAVYPTVWHAARERAPDCIPRRATYNETAEHIFALPACGG
ncbi:hypothetical protein BN2475_700082 [Paraburkholderia ribeironis]|uniref:Uncharacterized protein n=1 Tax=Paraburkholderia ribeironis TaxID=1247936 RepID=A0A1N7SHU2_9BURK|nr:hypothetical protein BN2475_700082 [Paraburkholderia ribeironis]